MGAEQKTQFQIDKSKCIRCGRCIPYKYFGLLEQNSTAIRH